MEVDSSNLKETRTQVNTTIIRSADRWAKKSMKVSRKYGIMFWVSSHNVDNCFSLYYVYISFQDNKYHISSQDRNIHLKSNQQEYSLKKSCLYQM